MNVQSPPTNRRLSEKRGDENVQRVEEYGFGFDTAVVNDLESKV